MDVPISVLRADLASWIDRVRHGEELVITDRGIPVARLEPIVTSPLIERLVREGVLSRQRPGPRPSARETARVAAAGSVSELVGDERR